MKFWLLWGLDALVALGFLYFFLVGIADGSVSSFNIVLWLGILSALGTVLGCGLFLKAKNQLGLAIGLLCLLAVPSVLALLFFLVILIANPRMN